MDQKLLNTAYLLSIFTIVYNIGEGIVSIFYGITDQTLALFGFGVDSFVEVISGFGIAHMIYRMKKAEVNQRDQFEIKALKITGTSFYILAIGLVIGSFAALITQTKPESTFAGVIISLVSIAIMYFLMILKLRTGKKLKSDAIIADANCTKTCLILSVVLFASSLGYLRSHNIFIDSIGSVAIAYFAFQEGREAFEKAKNISLSCNCLKNH